MDGIALNSTARLLNRYISLWQANYRSRRESMGWLVGSPANSTPCTATHTRAKPTRALVSCSHVLRFGMEIIGALLGWDGGWFRASIPRSFCCSSNNCVIYLYPLNWRWFDGWSGQFSGTWNLSKESR